MTDERRYDENEVEQIFAAAAAPVPATRGAAGSRRGLTLGELQEIGREVGIAPARIADAAASLEPHRPGERRRKVLGMPVGVGRSADLPRPLTDREWAVLLADLRETFGAAGRDTSAGEVRQWVNGNLHACVEPTVDGWRLRLGTVKGDAAAFNGMGVAGIVIGLVTSASLWFAGEPLTAGVFVLGGLGGGAFAFNALRLPSWARTRERQMDEIASRVRALLDAGDDVAP